MEECQPYSFKAKIPSPPSGGWGVHPYILNFERPAGTSRGVYTTRKVWYIIYHPFQWQGGEIIVGECAPLPGLSCDDVPEYETVLKETCKKLNLTGTIDWESLRPYPSILFGFEMAFRYLEVNSYKLWDTPFSQGKEGILTNGLIWMGDKKFMMKQIDDKVNDGFHCLKLKIGSLDFEEELQIIRYIRETYTYEYLQIRVDANGAFTPEEAPEKLERLAELDVESIEQPIRAGQWDEMAKLVETSPLPIALDEELIGINDPAEKIKLLDHICPNYIVIKPSLHGGFSGGYEWINEADEYGIFWWITSALESNIGLNAIAQWFGTFETNIPQGLGTGKLFTDNIEMPLRMRRDRLWYIE